MFVFFAFIKLPAALPPLAAVLTWAYAGQHLYPCSANLQNLQEHG